MADNLSSNDNIETTREIRGYRCSGSIWDIWKESIEDMKINYENVRAALAELRSLFERNANNLWEQEEEKHQNQEINPLSNQDSCQSILDIDEEI